MCDVAYCDVCDENIKFKKIKVMRTASRKGKEYTFEVTEAVCPNCGTTLYIPEIVMAELDLFNDIYRKDNGIISIEKIREIPKKYNIGKKPLSLLLGWGEMTFSRFYERDVPSVAYSDLLKRIYDDPEFYLSVLEKNKNCLPSDLAYRKSKEAVLKILGRSINTNNKLSNIIRYIIDTAEEVTPLALQKGLYYVQGFSSAFKDEFMIDDNFEVWEHGPVIPDVYRKYKQYKYMAIPHENAEKQEEDYGLTPAEKAICDGVIEGLLCYSGKTLEGFTHREPPWQSVDEPNGIIPKEIIQEYFKNVIKRFNMNGPEDIHKYGEYMFAHRYD